MAKITIVPWTSKKAADGTVPLYLVIHHAGKRAVHALDYRTKIKDWNPKEKELRKTHRDHAKINPKLRIILQDAKDILLDAHLADQEISAAGLKKTITDTSSPTSTDFLNDFANRIQELRDRGKHGSVDAYTPVLAKLTAYVEKSLTKATLPFSFLTVSFLRGFETYLIREHGNSTNTVSKNLGYIRSVLYIAIKEGRFGQDKNPFFNMHLQKTRAEKAKLTIEEIWRMEDKAFTSDALTNARNYFVFAFYAAGMRVSDVMYLSGQDIEQINGTWRLAYTMIKTGKASYPMALNEPAQKILRSYGWPDIKPDEYIFPIIGAGVTSGTSEGFVERKRATARLNKMLKAVGKACEIATPITTHMARHSWTYHLDRHNIPVQRISDTLSHGDLRTTQAYVKKIRSVEVDHQLLGILGRDQAKKTEE